MKANSLIRLLLPLGIAVTFTAVFSCAAIAQNAPIKIFISVDMEGIGGIGTAGMTSSTGKDYALSRQLMTNEVNAVIQAIRSNRDAQILVNDSHGDMQNVLHTELPVDVEYIQGNIKPLGMVQGLDATFDAAIFIGYHARAGTENAFLAHTGSGAVKGLWLNGVEVGEGGLNASFASALGVPVLLASGDETFARQFSDLTGARTVATKMAVGNQVARLVHPEKVLEKLREATRSQLSQLEQTTMIPIVEPVTIRMRFASTTRADILQAIPDMRRIDGFTVEYTAASMDEAYRLIRLMYKYVSW